MFLKSLLTKNRPFLEAAIALHQAGRVPANSYLLDLDTMLANARIMSDEARRLGLAVFAMTKQFGRNPPALDALKAGGVDRFVAVDIACARPIRDHAHQLAHHRPSEPDPASRGAASSGHATGILDRLQ